MVRALVDFDKSKAPVPMKGTSVVGNVAPDPVMMSFGAVSSVKLKSTDCRSNPSALGGGDGSS
jgi:hypothetical protein